MTLAVPRAALEEVGEKTDTLSSRQFPVAVITRMAL
jgi:hypothetical protein